MFSFVGGSVGMGVNSIAAPPGTQPGDLLLGITGTNGVSLGAPYTVVAVTDYTDGIAYKIATGSNDDMQGSNIVGTVAAYRGVGAPTDYSYGFFGQTALTHAISGSPVTGTGMVIAAFASHGGAGDTVLTAAGGWTQDYEAPAQPASVGNKFPMLWEHQAVTGSVTPTATSSVDPGGGRSWGGGIVALVVPLLSAGEGMLL